MTGNSANNVTNSERGEVNDRDAFAAQAASSLGTAPDVAGRTAALMGINIFHANGLSNCSQRVIMTAFEKNVPWHSHPIDLAKDEHRSKDYLRINPRGLVPALVHDGRIILESNAIIQYLDQLAAAPSLVPSSTDLRDRMNELLMESDSVQWDIKLTTFEFLLKPFARMTPEQLERYADNQVDSQLVEFHKKFNTTGFDRSELITALANIARHLEKLEHRLAGQTFLCGESLSLADISWIVNVHRFDLLGVPLDGYPNVDAWHERIKARPSYSKASERLEAAGMLAGLRGYRAKREAEGSGVRTFL